MKKDNSVLPSAPSEANQLRFNKCKTRENNIELFCQFLQRTLILS